ncbi:glycoside hydrolase [Auriculariales sp. MPI-PUGE-AT-0066]|nr:glycoside hydrolase [Auriculariales sp. MPI-PUGE-AT-0066]
MSEPYMNGYDNDAARHFYPQHTPQAYAYTEKPAGAHAIHAKTQKRKNMILLIVGCAIILILAVILAIYFCVIKPVKDDGSKGSAASGSSSSANVARLIVGKDGDDITTSAGTTFTYRNKFGGFFVVDEANPFNDGAQAQSYTPPLNTSWKFGEDRIMGVNLGGWLVPEPFIAPQLYEPYLDNPDVNGDEWSLSIAMANDTANGGLSQLENHYKTFITEEDFAQIAAAGLNWIRLPVPFNAFGTIEGEPFLPNVAWNYTLKAFEWARKYGIRINLDLHTMPGSQNGLNHSGKKGYVAFASSVMGLANAQRGLDIIRRVTEFITQPEYKNLVPILSIINEPQGQDQQVMHAFYLEAYYMIRNITGTGEGNGPYIAVHDHFEPIANWANFLHGADRLILDSHPYFTFGGQDVQSIDRFPPLPCGTWGPQFNASRNTFGVTIAGEWSLGASDCGQYIWGLRDKPHTTNCDEYWNDYTKWTDDMKAKFLSLAKSHMDALGDFFFWTWKTGVSRNSPQGGTLVGAPCQWNYKLGLEQGWIPDDPRSSTGECARLNVVAQPDQYFKGTFESWQTGGLGAGTIAPTATAGIDVWPPPALATIGGLPADGWFNNNDNAGGMVPITGCTYPDSWNPGDVPPALCTGPAAADASASAASTPTARLPSAAVNRAHVVAKGIAQVHPPRPPPTVHAVARTNLESFPLLSPI